MKSKVVRVKAKPVEPTTVYQDFVAGIPVTVRLDAAGWPVGATVSLPPMNAEGWPMLNDPRRRLDEDLAVRTALANAQRAAQRARAKASSAKAAAASAQKRASAIANEYLAQAHQQHPDYGKDRLTRCARRLAANAGVELAQRDEITEERARRFLERQRKVSKR